MFWNFKDLVSDLYGEWEDCLMESLKLPERTYFESICNQTATMDDLEMSLYYLSNFLSEKFGQRVIVLIDEYETPINRAYEHGYFNNVCSLYLSL
jgi:Predicted AAA-ATPase